MAEEEATELTTAADEAGKAGMYMSENATALQKAARKTMSEHIKKAKEMVSDHYDKVTKAHADHRDAMHAHIEKMGKLLGAEEAGEVGDQPKSIDPEKEGTENTLKALKAQIAELEKKVSSGAPNEDDTKPMTKADVQKMIDAAKEQSFNEGMQTVIKAISPESDTDKDGVKKANANITPTNGIGTRGTVLTNGPIIHTMPVTKAQDGQAQPAVAEPPKVDMKKVLAGDREEQLKFMSSAVPGDLPATLIEPLSGR